MAANNSINNTLQSPFNIGATSVTSTGAQLNYLSGLTISNGGIVYSGASALATLAATATAGQLLTSGASTTPAWTTSTYPLTNVVNTILYASSANVMSALATANSAVLVTSAGGAPSLSTTLPNIAIGTPSSGTLTNCTGYTVANLSDAAWTDFSGTIGYTGFTGSVTTTLALYKKIGTTVFVNISASGTSNSTAFTITGLPFAAKRSNFTNTMFGTDANANTNVWGSFSATSTTLSLFTATPTGNWTAAGGKSLQSEFFYET